MNPIALQEARDFYRSSRKTSFAMEHAKSAAAENRLQKWTVKYLREEGMNKSLAERIESADLKSISLQEIPLKKFRRIIGPEKGQPFPESQEVFENRITSLTKALRSGAVFPPFVITDFWELGTLSDGNHRFETLVREGCETYQAVVCFEKEESEDFLKN